MNVTVNQLKYRNIDHYNVWVCEGCSAVKSEDDEPLPMRECSNENCGTKFFSEERNCEDCNRPFTRKLATHGCEECQDEVEMVLTAVYGKCKECDTILGDTMENSIDDYAESEGGAELFLCGQCTTWQLVDDGLEAPE